MLYLWRGEMIGALRYAADEFRAVLVTREFRDYMSSGNNVQQFTAALYEHTRRTRDFPRLREVLRHDQRDKQHSAAYLKMFRQAVLYQEQEIALIIAQECEYPTDLVADILQEDKEITIFPNETYMAVVRAEQAKEVPCVSEECSDDSMYPNSFLDDYLAYRIITYHNEGELLAHLILADKVSNLWLVDTLTPSVLKQYVEWKQNSSNPNESIKLDRLAQRLPEHGREEALYTSEEEDARRRTLTDARAYIFAGEQRWIRKQRDVNRILFPIGRIVGGLKDTQKALAEIIAGRYRYLPW